ncbi:hypothetical protein Vafri_3173 [Volvox africanus]|uniref:Uncharacterized protein n=1 Tax=Volvox africanus TaxID=51714 RepID=A0A8J4AR78_9CHLO|nr:hypothetical protein Vafri_3173 [Volvox africanus]
MGQEEENALDFVPRLSFLPIEWRNIGAAFGLKDRSGPAATGRCSFVVKEGIDAADVSTTGRVVEGASDVGVALKLNTLALGITAGNLSFRTGLDNPTAALAQRIGESSVPSLKVMAVKQFKDENYVAASYDLKTRKPELSACWAGDAKTERATLLVRVDPIMRSVKLDAAVSTPGPEWRNVLYNDVTDRIEEPADDGARHTLYVQHEARGRNLMHATRIGCRLDLGRLVNYAADFFDYNIEERIPGFIWNIPLLPQLYYMLVPPENDDQVRHHITGWELDISHDFNRGPRPSLLLCKSFKYGNLSASYDMAANEAGLSYGRRGLVLGTRLGRLEGQGWKRPSLHISVEPLTLLC